MTLRPWIAKHFGPHCAYPELAAESTSAQIQSINDAREVAASGRPIREVTPNVNR